MKRCDAMVDAGRRKFLTGAGVIAAGSTGRSRAQAPARLVRRRRGAISS
jgi:hypothetical protein